MARNIATTVENNFVLGLITERTELRFPQNAATDMDNCVLDLYGRVSRRQGMDFEEDYTVQTIVEGTTADAYTEYLWEGVSGDSATSFFVQQTGKTLRFSNADDSNSISSNFTALTINLTTYVPTLSPENPANYPCQYAAGFGSLIIVNAAIDPIVVKYDPITETLMVTEVALQTRDFKGVDDGMELTFRPTDSVASLKTDEPNHYYNIINQGWHSGDALSQWDTARTDMPSNADIIGLYRASATDAFDNAQVTSRSPGNTSAPRGHYILDAFNPDRTAALVAEGFTGVVVGTDNVVVDRTLGTNIGDMTALGGLAAAFDGILTTTAANSACKTTSASAYVGKNYTAASGSTIAAVQVTFPTDFTPTSRTVRLYAKATAPANATDGTLLGSVDAGTAKTPVIIPSSDTTTVWNYFWVTIIPISSSAQYISETTYYSSLDSTANIVYRRPSTTTFFAGRVFYSGLDESDLGSKIFFTRIIENDDHYAQCYSDNDPTSETLATFLASDGGVISIPECGTIVKLFAAQSSVIVLASNGIWLVSGSGGLTFSATSYQVRKLSGVGSRSPQSVVDYKGLPIWWGEDGIYTMQFNPNYDSFDVVSLTQDSIKTFYLAIPVANRIFVKGVYHPQLDILTWLYNDSASFETADHYKYTRALNMLPRSKAFYPWTFEEADVSIRGIIYFSDAQRLFEPSVKYTVTYTSGTKLVYAQESSSTYKDWSTYAQTIANDVSKEVDYTSYFLTGYYIHGETQRFFQGNYVFVFVDQDTQGSCMMKTIYDWSTSGNSGKWSPEQQIYPDWQTLQSVNYRRLKTRGKGRSMQMYFESEEGKPFSIIGWSAWESGNANI